VTRKVEDLGKLRLKWEGAEDPMQLLSRFQKRTVMLVGLGTFLPLGADDVGASVE